MKIMSLSEINNKLQNNLTIEVEFPEYCPDYPYELNKYYNKEMQSSFNKNVNQLFCNFGPNIEIIPLDGLHWTAFFYPFTESHKMKNIGIFTSVWFGFDDIFENECGEVGRSENKAQIFVEMVCKLVDNVDDIRNISVYEIQTWKPFMFALYACLHAIYLEAGSTCWKYFAIGFKNQLKSCIVECKLENGTFIVDQNELLEFRLTNSGGYAYIALQQYAGGFELTEQEYKGEFVQNVLRYAIGSLIMCNDLYSFRKEMKECNGKLETSKNMIAVLMKTQSLTLQEAFNKMITIIENMDDLYAKAKKNLFASNPSNEAKMLCHAIDYMLGGNLVTHTGSKRYNGVNFKGCIPSCGTFIYSPTETIIIKPDNREDKFEKFRKYYE